VGQYPAGTPDEALAFFTERFDALSFGSSCSCSGSGPA
jgi:hypothetical protein